MNQRARSGMHAAKIRESETMTLSGRCRCHSPYSAQWATRSCPVVRLEGKRRKTRRPAQTWSRGHLNRGQLYVRWAHEQR